MSCADKALDAGTERFFYSIQIYLARVLIENYGSMGDERVVTLVQLARSV
jgi:hypothetical protein